jgi:O-glycosyl hydrolase
MARKFALILVFGLLFSIPAWADYTAIVGPGSVLVTNFQGWGTSLCWWANVVGAYPNRQDYCDLAFSQLKLNIVRYNIGGGENPAQTNSITNYRAIMQGFEPTNGIWNWNADQNQRWVLRESIALGANIVDAFANSPPWWMTVSGSVTGAVGGTNNLQVAYENAFAGYLATVVSNLTLLDGVTFNFITPMNEPTGSSWKYENGKQEGCDMSPDQQARVVNDLRAQLNAQAPTLGIDSPEDENEQSSINDLNAYTNGALANVALASTHTYGANNPAGLHSAALSSGKPLWVAEYGDGDGSGMTMAERIYNDVTQMKVRAWVYWQVVDNANGWGFLYNSLTTNSTGGFTTSYTINKKFYVMGQFSEFVRPGCNIISVNDNNTLAAFDPTNSNLVLVMINTNTISTNVTYSLSAFTSLPSQVAVYQTCGSLGEYVSNLPSLPVSSGEFTASIPANSVTTFVLTNVTLAPMLFAHGASSAPTNSTDLYAGANPILSVTATGTQPLCYQWFSNNLVLAGVTNASYTPPASTPGASNIYECVITNTAGSVTSQVWSVSVVATPIALYPRAVLALHPMGYWRLNELPDNGSGNQGVICHDEFGANNAIYSNAILAQNGYNPITDPAETAASFGSFLPTNSDAAQIANVDFSAPPNENAEFSIVAWVKGNAQTVDAGIVSKGYGGGGEQFNLDTGSDSLASHGFRFFVRDALGNTGAANSAIAPDGNWHHLAAICDEANGLVHLYVDGVDNAEGSIRRGMALLAASGGAAPGTSLMSIGSRTASASSTGFANQFVGTIDDVALYNYALTASEVQQLYAAASVPAINITQSQNGPTINFTGTLLSSTNLSGPYAPVPGASPMTYVVPTPGAQMFFRASNQ